MTPLFRQIEGLLKTVPDGWCDVPKAITLAAYTTALKADTILEIGVFGGRSAFPMMEACKHKDSGLVICVDPWSIPASVEGQVAKVDTDWWGTVNHELVYQRFVSNVVRLRLEKFCEIHRMKSCDFAPPKRPIDIAHIDGNHGPDAVLDTRKYAPLVRSEGLVVLDDLNWNGGHVGMAAEWLTNNGFIHLHPLGTGAVYMKL